jgi:hypothetical protein
MSTVAQPATGDAYGARQICQHGRRMTSLPWRWQCKALKHCCSQLLFVPHMVSLVQREWLNSWMRTAACKHGVALWYICNYMLALSDWQNHLAGFMLSPA